MGESSIISRGYVLKSYLNGFLEKVIKLTSHFSIKRFKLSLKTKRKTQVAF